MKKGLRPKAAARLTERRAFPGALMKKGLRRQQLTDLATEFGFSGCPDEEGITTPAARACNPDSFAFPGALMKKGLRLHEPARYAGSGPLFRVP